MGLGHFTNVQTATNMWEPIYKNLFEVSIDLPLAVQANLPGIKSILLENTTNVTLPTYPKIDSAEQRFKYSTRLYPKMPTSTSLVEQAVKFNLNQWAPVQQNSSGNVSGRVPVFRALKDWYDLLWNNETGQLNYKGNLVSTVVIDVHDKEGLVIRRVIWHNAFITGFTGWDGDMDWATPDIIPMNATFSCDYWEDFYY